MKNSSRFFSFALAGTLAAAFFCGGCAGPEHRRTTGEYFDDQAINARVKSALLQDDDVAGTEVSTTTFDGVVQLSGFVDEAEQRERAEEVATEVPGVEAVINNITINPRDPQYGTPREDEQPGMEMESPEPHDPQEPQPETEPQPQPEQN